MIALDIGSQNISALFFEIIEEMKEEGKVVQKRHINVLGFSRVNQQGNHHHSQQLNDMGSIISHCQKAIQDATKHSRIKPSQLILGISGDFIRGKTITLSEKREDSSTKINSEELRNILQKLEWKAFTETRKNISEETGYPEVEIKLINSFITNSKIDNQPAQDLIGFQGKELEFSFFNAFTPQNYYDALQSVAHELELELVEIVSEPFALWQCIETEEGRENSVILIDIGCNTTCLAVVENNALIDAKSFGLGGESITKRLALELNISLVEAEKLKKAYSEDKLESKSKSLVRELISHDLELWVQAVCISLAEIKTQNGLPTKIYLSGGGSNLGEFKEILNESKWAKKLPFPRKPHASDIEDQKIEKIGGNKKGINKENIMTIALAKVALQVSNSENALQQMLRKIIGIMKM
ncbi:pilus assembly protein PilM [Candidatus Peregrinibacteria bacterium]|nr:MAG: pilus assembly protein PilM [Candidatus Peregrinibacteria bacterium]